MFIRFIKFLFSSKPNKPHVAKSDHQATDFRFRFEKVEITRDRVTSVVDASVVEVAHVDTVEVEDVVIRGRCYVVDGDTIRIGNQAIRLAGIDAPELDQPYGKQAKWALVGLTKGQVVTASMHRDTSYDRAVAVCTLADGRDLSEEMVKLGLAIDWGKFSGGKYRRFEPEGVRKKLWRSAAKHNGKFF